MSDEEKNTQPNSQAYVNPEQSGKVRSSHSISGINAIYQQLNFGIGPALQFQWMRPHPKEVKEEIRTFATSNNNSPELRRNNFEHKKNGFTVELPSLFNPSLLSECLQPSLSTNCPTNFMNTGDEHNEISKLNLTLNQSHTFISYLCDVSEEKIIERKESITVLKMDNLHMDREDVSATVKMLRDLSIESLLLSIELKKFVSLVSEKVDGIPKDVIESCFLKNEFVKDVEQKRKYEKQYIRFSFGIFVLQLLADCVASIDMGIFILSFLYPSIVDFFRCNDIPGNGVDEIEINCEHEIFMNIATSQQPKLEKLAEILIIQCSFSKLSKSKLKTILDQISCEKAKLLKHAGCMELVREMKSLLTQKYIETRSKCK